jgi:CBS domain-containing protein
MRASDLQTSLPMVGRNTTALEAARFIAADDLAGLVIADESGAPSAVVSAIDVLGLLVPGYVVDDIALAGVFDEAATEEIWAKAGQSTIGALIDDDRVHIYELLRVDADDTILEVAARMANARAQIALIKGSRGHDAQFVTLSALMDAILTFCAPSGSAQADQ